MQSKANNVTGSLSSLGFCICHTYSKPCGILKFYRGKKGSQREIPLTNFTAFAVNFHRKLLLLDYNSFLKLPGRKNLDDFEMQTFSTFSILMLVIR